MNKTLILLAYGVVALEHHCPLCMKPVCEEAHEFRDELSKREFLISGLCQACQDEMFFDREEE